MNNFFQVKKLFLRFSLLRSSVVLTLFAGLLLHGSAVFAEDRQGTGAPPDTETRSVVGPADGFFPLKGGVSLDVAREKALENAKRAFLKIAKNTIRFQLTVRGKPPVYDIAQMGLHNLTVLRHKDLGVVKSGDEYHVAIEAKVVYALKQKPGAQPDIKSNGGSAAKPSVAVKTKTHTLPSALSDPNAPLTVKVWTEKKQFSEGERIRFYIQGNRDFYARIVNLDSDGNMIQLLPNQFRQSTFFKGKQKYTIPDDSQGDRFSIVSTPPYGTDTIVTFASEVPLGSVNLTPVGQGLGQFSGTKESFSNVVTRGMKVVGNDTNNKPVGFYESTWKFQTIPKQ